MTAVAEEDRRGKGRGAPQSCTTGSETGTRWESFYFYVVTGIYTSVYYLYSHLKFVIISKALIHSIF